jgi:cellulose biosynthesis protein BcsQ
MKVYALYNLKGGVGKTTSTVNLSYYSAQDGNRTLIWDFDPQGSASFYFKVKSKFNKGGIKEILNEDTSLEDAILETDYENLDILPATSLPKPLIYCTMN